MNLDGIFDSLTAEDFALPDTHIDQLPSETYIESPFDAWVQARIREARVAYAAADGEISPIITLATPTINRMLNPLDEVESMGEFVDRAAAEARRIRARWAFIFNRMPVAVGPPTGPEATLPPLESSAWFDQAEDDGHVLDAVFWYADNVDGPSRHGFMAVTSEVRLERPREVSQAQTSKLFGQILNYPR